MSLDLPPEFEDFEALLTRAQLSGRFKQLALPVAPTTLSTYASRGSGPPFQKFGNKPMYRWGPAVKWAESRFSPIGTSCSEISAKRAAQSEGVEAKPPERAPQNVAADEKPRANRGRPAKAAPSALEAV